MNEFTDLVFLGGKSLKKEQNLLEVEQSWRFSKTGPNFKSVCKRRFSVFLSNLRQVVFLSLRLSLTQ